MFTEGYKKKFMFSEINQFPDAAWDLTALLNWALKLSVINNAY